MIRCKGMIAAQRNYVREAILRYHRLAHYSPSSARCPAASPRVPSGETSGATVWCLVGKYFTLGQQLVSCEIAVHVLRRLVALTVTDTPSFPAGNFWRASGRGARAAEVSFKVEKCSSVVLLAYEKCTKRTSRFA